MSAPKLARVIRADLRRNFRHFALASIGIIVGIAAFTFFLALGLGVRAVVLGEIFPLDKLEVVARTTEIGLGPVALGVGNDTLDDNTVARLKGIPGVDATYPKMRMTAPSVGYGGKSILGTDLAAEMIADGIDPLLIAPDIKGKYRFADLQAEYEAKDPIACQSDKDCPEEAWCPKESTKPRKAAKNATVDVQAGVCRPYIPVVASPHMVELYNGALRRAHQLPKLNPEFVVGLTFELDVGASMVAASRKDEIIPERAMLVGYSDKAIPLGATMPLPYVQRYNSRYNGERAATQYHSIIVHVSSKDVVAQVAKSIQDEGFAITDTGAEQAAMLIRIFMLVFGLVSAVIVGIAAINIMHVFFMLIYERQRELGIMRAVGARKSDIRRIILGEAAIVGLVAGGVGVTSAIAMARIFDRVSANYLPDFPYKPETYFAFEPAIIGAALLFAMGFCVLGALLPAWRAARIDPVIVLTGR